MPPLNMPPCALCGTPVNRANRSYCSKSCATSSRSYRNRGITCTVEGCDAFVVGRGWCKKHIRRIQTNGTTELKDKFKAMTEAERFWLRVDKSGECWLWTGEKNNKGYGHFRTYSDNRAKKHLAHRYAFAAEGNDIVGLVLRHSCDTPACVRPAHLTAGTQLENMRDARDKGRMNTKGLEIGWALRRSSSGERRNLKAGAA